MLPEFVLKRRSDRRTDVVVMYLDGEGKSGQYHASRYAEENTISNKAICSSGRFIEHLGKRNDKDGKIAAIIIVALAATPDGEAKVREAIAEINWPDCDVRVCEPLTSKAFAFTADNGIWKNAAELDRAKSLCEDIGAAIYPDNPLGFGTLGMLVVFPTTCPNNPLPILHSPATHRSGKRWPPLFPRLVN